MGTKGLPPLHQAACPNASSVVAAIGEARASTSPLLGHLFQPDVGKKLVFHKGPRREKVADELRDAPRGREHPPPQERLIGQVSVLDPLQVAAEGFHLGDEVLGSRLARVQGVAGGCHEGSGPPALNPIDALLNSLGSCLPEQRRATG